MVVCNFYQWKAAKEELNENEEDEPENAYEILERKRQREIEVCRVTALVTDSCVFDAFLVPYISFSCRNGVLSKLPVEKPKIMLIFSPWVVIGK